MSIQNEIKDQFLQKSISNTDFLQKLMELDQSTPYHHDCYENIKVMEIPEIKRLFDSYDRDIRFNYYDYLRFFYFHAFQDQAITNGSTLQAINYLRSANKLSEVLQEIYPDESILFSKYILGTLHYMNNEPEKLNQLIKEFEQGDKTDFTFSNINVLYSLYNGLISNKNVDYKRDY